ncbi:MAG: DUF1761 domain-containing protein [Gammaproteobacteria bacterium]
MGIFGIGETYGVIWSAVSWQLAIGLILAYGLGMLWYGEKGFGKLWMELQPHRTNEVHSGMWQGMVSSAADLILSTCVIILLVAAYGLAAVDLFVGAVWLGTFTNNFFKGGSVRLWMIDVGYLTTQYLIVLLALYLAGFTAVAAAAG